MLPAAARGLLLAALMAGSATAFMGTHTAPGLGLRATALRQEARRSPLGRGGVARLVARSGMELEKPMGAGEMRSGEVDCASPTPKAALDVEKGAFAVGSALLVVSTVIYYSSGNDGTIAGPIGKLGAGIFFIGVALNYAETYNRCAYIRFIREALLQPQTIARRYRRILRMVDGNIFKFLLPGRSYDVTPDGKPIIRDKIRK